MEKSLPDFRNPPVAEVVLAIQFEPLAGVTTGHLGQFAALLGNDWRIHAEGNRLGEVQERFGKTPALRMPGMGIRLQQQTLANRLQVVEKSNDRMIQLQDTHFVYNWIKKQQAYPRFDTVFAEFDAKFGLLRGFLLDCELGMLRMNQWEVTYVNHIPTGDLWSSSTQWGEIIPGLLSPIKPYGGTIFENLNGDWRSEIPDKRGRLHVTVKQKVEDEQPVLIFQLTARGPIVNDDFRDGLNIGHTTIVTAFVDLTSQKAQKHWK